MLLKRTALPLFEPFSMSWNCSNSILSMLTSGRLMAEMSPFSMSCLYEGSIIGGMPSLLDS